MFEPTAVYSPNPHRYDTMTYNRAGTSGLKLPAVSLGFWHNFGDITPFDQMKSLVFTAFDNGITHFIPADSRMAHDPRFLNDSALTEKLHSQVADLNNLASERGQTLAEMSLAWLLHDGKVTSVLAGASKPQQILENIGALKNTHFSDEELKLIDEISAR